MMWEMLRSGICMIDRRSLIALVLFFFFFFIVELLSIFVVIEILAKSNQINKLLEGPRQIFFLQFLCTNWIESYPFQSHFARINNFVQWVETGSCFINKSFWLEKMAIFFWPRYFHQVSLLRYCKDQKSTKVLQLFFFI